MTVHLSSLAHQIMMLAAQYSVMPGQALPDEPVEALLDSAPEKGEAAFDEIYAHNLLEDDGGWLVLTEAGFDYILEQYKNDIFYQ
ncbi:hypothetical protein Q0A17_12970 [Citrobacter sp. S2-9]|uniref:Uncharacterized protein n=1 Tax=Citrobacter enshiensis TaxID=2971264 RepID=A0ABT8PVC8_9ENTR|nr:hypothetical protein [Citrobacter enshiensis]MDN8600315.1 hypothetical protein [Citrobacter enshiensis]